MTEITVPLPLAPVDCARCGTQVAAGLLSCPSCKALLHAAHLKELAALAEAATAGRHLQLALTHWRSALELLPPETNQFRTISDTISELTRRIDAGEDVPAPPSASGAATASTAAGAGGLLLLGTLAFKLKSLPAFLLGAGKWLIAGLSKSSTLITMLLSFGAYWTLWGWKFAAGFVLSIYVHEMGHVYRLTRYGIQATAPMFVPGLGALIRVNQTLVDPREDARVGLAGPWWGLGAAVACWGLYVMTGNELFRALAAAGAVINLFNLIPIGQLDGGRGARALTTRHRLLVIIVTLGLWWISSEGLLILIALVMGMRLAERGPDRSHPAILAEMIALLALLSLLLVAIGGPPGVPPREP